MASTAQQKGSTNGSSQQKKDGDDLTTILDPSQRADLTLLVANVTESMRQVILDNFSATAGMQNKSLVRDDMTEDEKIMSATIDPGTADVEAFDRERKLKEQFVKELTSPKVKMLRSDTLKAYDEWRELVLTRVGGVVNSKNTTKDQLNQKVEKPQPGRPQAPQIGKITKIPVSESTVKFKDIYPPTKTPLTRLSIQQRTLVLHALFLLMLSLEHYNAPSRVLLLNLTSSLKLSLKVFEEDEAKVAKGLLEAAKEMTADEETKKKVEANKDNRKWRVGLATAAGAAIIGVTGGLAAPLVAAGVGSVMGGLGLGATAAAGYLGSVAGSTVLVGGLFGAYGGRMTGQMMDKYAKEVEDFAFLPVHGGQKTSEDQKEGAKQASEHDHKLRVTICISGWLTDQTEVIKPWRVMGKGAEVFGLRFELESLLNLGNAIQTMLTSAAWGYAQKEVIQRTIFAELMGAMWPIGLLKVARIVDNPFSVAMSRADKAGAVLADALINKAQGERPVTLIGYSLGARVIYTCLQSLAKRRAYGLIENVVMMGSPAPSDGIQWRILRSVVSGRLVNVYSENDYILGFMYRTSNVQYGVAGLQKVEGLSGVENVDVSEEVSSHQRYRFLVGSILKKIGFEDIDMAAVEREQAQLQKMEEEEKQRTLEAQKNRLIRRQSAGGKVDEDAEAEEELKDMQATVDEKTKKGLMTRAMEYFYLPSAGTKDAEKAAGSAKQVAQNPKAAANGAGDTAKDAKKTASATTQSYASWATSQLPNIPYRGKQDSATDTTNKAAGSPAPGARKPSTPGKAPKLDSSPGSQSYTQKAAGYIPSMPKSIPTFGFGGNAKPASPAAGRPQSGRKPSAPKLDRQPSGVKSPPPLTKTPSGTRPPKLEQRPSGVRSPQTSSPSLAKSPPPLEKRTSNAAQVTKSPKSPSTSGS